MHLFRKTGFTLAIALVSSFAVLAQPERNPTTQPTNTPNTNTPKTTPPTQASVPDTRGYNPNSVRPIHESDILFKRTLWRQVDLNEKQNRPFMAVNNEITKVIFDAVKSGKVTPYTTDSLDTKLAISDFMRRLQDQNVLPIDTSQRIREIKDDSFLTKKEKNDQIKQVLQSGGGTVDKRYADFTQMEIKEDMIFDKQRSRMYYDIQAITIFLPGTNNQGVGGGVDVRVASFKFKDLVKYFRNTPAAIWFNEQNNREHKNLADAFELRLFSSIIYKISNPRDASLETVYNGKRQGLVAAQQLEHKLMEYEHNLWEF
jgi:gliding motility associated protien GldN